MHVRRDHLSLLNIPVLVAWGRQDRILPLEHARRAIERLKAGHLEIIENCGHLHHIEKPDRLAAALRNFLTHLI
ncbi:MAG: alpha/beta fold hydrolase [Desulfobacteraceae bacterium]|nr:MAG: alpha/beta fold hydrolase [Desulfobacteraceae bacterium]